MAVGKRTRFEVLHRDGHRCRYCGTTTAQGAVLTVDHVIPQSLGGSDKPENLVAACRDCNAGKASSNPDAPLVAEVSDDALRWAQAMEEAHHRGRQEIEESRKVVRHFTRQWVKRGLAPGDLPGDFDQSVTRFVSLGLTLDELDHFLGMAVAAYRVPDSSKFVWFAKVCWNTIRSRTEHALKIVRGEVAEDPDEDGMGPFVQLGTIEAIGQDVFWQLGLLLERSGFYAGELLRDHAIGSAYVEQGEDQDDDEFRTEERVRDLLGVLVGWISIGINDSRRGTVGKYRERGGRADELFALGEFAHGHVWPVPAKGAA